MSGLRGGGNSRDAEVLAVDGGVPVRTEPFPAWPFFTPAQRAAADHVLATGRTNLWTGDECLRFETEFARLLGVPHALSVANGTVGLEVALRACGIGPGDDVIVPARTFIATASSVVAVGARPVCADVDRESQCVTPATLGDAVTPATRAVIVVHLAGWACDGPALADWCDRRGLDLIEDCAQSLGATYDDAPTGTFGRVGVFSFCQDKILTTGGEGGMLVTSDDAVHRRAWSQRDHGKDFALSDRSAPVTFGFSYVHESFGTNVRMTEMQGALGRTGLGELGGWVESRRRNAAMLEESLAEVPGLRLVAVPSRVRHAFYKFYAFVDESALSDGWDRDRIGRSLAAEGIPCGTGVCPELYRERAFVERGWGRELRLPVASELGRTSLMLRVDPALGEVEMQQTATALARIMRKATR